MNSRLLFLLVILVSGCQGSSEMVPVSGVIKLDGKPFPFASVMFVPQDSAGRDATGTTDEQGRFVLSTVEPRDGAKPGKYKVVIFPGAPATEGAPGMTADQAMEAASKQPAKAPKSPISAAYTRPDQTPLAQDVPPSGDIVIELKSE